jgi:steroid 5-alpha reductase family enzyme
MSLATSHNSLSAVIQNILLFMLGLPAYQVLILPSTPLGTSDYIIGSLALLVLALEFTADNQQWSYQNFKHSGGKIQPHQWPGANIRWTANDRKRGFVSRGLWAWSRHPNFACEQTFWVSR